LIFTEQETKSSWIHWMFTYGNILLFVGKCDHTCLQFHFYVR